jgi:hypothetical protein
MYTDDAEALPHSPRPSAAGAIAPATMPGLEQIRDDLEVK